MWGFEEEVGFAGCEGVGEGGAAFAGFDGEEAAEVEGVAGEAGADECGDDGGGAGEDFQRGVGLDAGLDEAVSWVGDAGHAGIGDDGDGFTGAGCGSEFGCAPGFVVFVKGDEGFAGDAVVGEEGAGVAGVFAGDAVGGFEDLDGAQGEVGEIADGCGDDDDAAAGFHGDGMGGRCTGKVDGGRRNCGRGGGGDSLSVEHADRWMVGVCFGDWLFAGDGDCGEGGGLPHYPALDGTNTTIWTNVGNISDSTSGTLFVVETSTDLRSPQGDSELIDNAWSFRGRKDESGFGLICVPYYVFRPPNHREGTGPTLSLGMKCVGNTTCLGWLVSSSVSSIRETNKSQAAAAIFRYRWRIEDREIGK